MGYIYTCTNGHFYDIIDFCMQNTDVYTPFKYLTTSILTTSCRAQTIKARCWTINGWNIEEHYPIKNKFKRNGQKLVTWETGLMQTEDEIAAEQTELWFSRAGVNSGHL